MKVFISTFFLAVSLFSAATDDEEIINNLEFYMTLELVENEILMSTEDFLEELLNDVAPMGGVILPEPVFITRWPAALNNQITPSEARSKWNAMAENEKNILRERRKRFLDMDEIKKRQLRERYDNWRAMPPERKERLIVRFNAFLKMTPETKKILREKFIELRKLSPAARKIKLQELRARKNEQPGDKKDGRQQRRERNAGLKGK